MSSPFAYQAPAAATSAAVERTFLRQVFAWMLLGLALTTGVAIYLNSAGSVVDYFDNHPATFWVLIAAQLGMVFGLSFALPRLSANVAAVWPDRLRHAEDQGDRGARRRRRRDDAEAGDLRGASPLP